MKKFFKIVSLFIFCITSIYNGKKLKLDRYNLIDIWKYCERWENGEL